MVDVVDMAAIRGQLPDGDDDDDRLHRRCLMSALSWTPVP